jgi:hypothetical protein
VIEALQAGFLLQMKYTPPKATFSFFVAPVVLERTFMSSHLKNNHQPLERIVNIFAPNKLGSSF